MDIKGFNNLKIDNSTKLYDLTQITYIDISNNLSIPVYPYTVEEHFAGRIDLICDDIYQDTDNVDFLLHFNNIINPLNIPTDTVIYYVDAEAIKLFEFTDEESLAEEAIANLTNNNLTNINKKQRIDKNRINSNTLPPTLTDNLTDPVQIKGNQIVIGENLFK